MTENDDSTALKALLCTILTNIFWLSMLFSLLPGDIDTDRILMAGLLASLGTSLPSMMCTIEILEKEKQPKTFGLFYGMAMTISVILSTGAMGFIALVVFAVK